MGNRQTESRKIAELSEAAVDRVQGGIGDLGDQSQLDLQLAIRGHGPEHGAPSGYIGETEKNLG